MFTHLLNEFRNSKVTLENNPNQASSGTIQNYSGIGTNKYSKKKASSIEKKSTFNSQNQSDMMKKSNNRKGINQQLNNSNLANGAIHHKKSKSYINQNMEEVMKENSNFNAKNYPVLYQQQVLYKKIADNTLSIDHSFVKNSMNKSYERLMAETLEAQNTMLAGYNQNQQAMQMGAQGYSTNTHKKKNNMTLQFGPGQKRTTVSANVSQARLNIDNYEQRTSQFQGNQQSKSNNSSHKSLNHSKYDQQHKKRSRRQDQLYIGTSGKPHKIDSHRGGSKKNSPNNHTITLTGGKNSHVIREPRTKPSSPERSLILGQSYKQGGKQFKQNQVYISGSQMANQKEERAAMNMISAIGKKQDIKINTNQPTFSSGFSSQVSNTYTNKQAAAQKQEFQSIQSQTNKRKNFKNMFYSPKGSKEPFTEPHSKVVSQAHTKDNSPIRGAEPIYSYQPSPGMIHNQQVSHPKINSKPPTQVKSKIVYNVKEPVQQQYRIHEHESNPASSFVDDQYQKNNSYGGYKRDIVEISFESNQQLSQTGTPINIQMKGGFQGPIIKQGKKTLHVSHHSLQNASMPGASSSGNINPYQPKAKPVIQEKGKPIIHHPHTTGVPSKNNSQAPSPAHNRYNNLQINPQLPQAKYKFQSEVPSPQNMSVIGNDSTTQVKAVKKRVQSIGGFDDINNQGGDQKYVMTFKGKPLVLTGATKGKVNNPQTTKEQEQQQFMFNQYMKNKKPRFNKYESQEGSLERTTEPLLNKSEASALRQSQTQIQTPRTKEVGLIKSLIKECFEEYKKAPKTRIELYKIGKMLGKGAFGKVNLGLHRLTRKLVAIKSINMEYMKDECSKKKMNNEINILKMLRHPSVVKMLENFDIEKHYMIVMELCPGGDLLNYVRKRRKLTEKYAKFVFQQIMEGIAYLHTIGVVHRDIKLDNILLDGHGNIKIGDFGVSKKCVDHEILFEQCGTPAYIAPEIVRELGYKGYPVDIWSAGVCLYAMLYGNVPFKANQMGDLNKMIMETEIEYKDTCSEEARDLMQRMLQKNPNKRLTAEQVLSHSWFDDVDEHIDIFDEQELDLIKKEFTYVSQKAKLKELQNRKPEDLNTEFTEHSINNTENDLLRNNSSRSVILCPFNTQSQTKQCTIYEENKDLFIDKDIIIRFNVRVRELDRQYEKFNNQDFDNGVYHKYAYNQGKNKDGEKEEAKLLEEEIRKEDVDQVDNFKKGKRQRDLNLHNFYLKMDENIIKKVEEYGFPQDYILKCLKENINNHCTTSYYLLCLDQNY